MLKSILLHDALISDFNNFSFKFKWLARSFSTEQTGTENNYEWTDIKYSR
jgi:hypothetical protein